MKSRHIKENLDRTKFDQLPAEETAEIAEHLKTCADCRAAFRAARVAAVLLTEKSRIAAPEASTFFQAKVLNAWRERRTAPQPFIVFRRWWQASATLVMLMFLTIGGLIAASVIGARSPAAAQSPEFEAVLYSPETVILNQKPPRDLTTEQIYEVIDENK